MSELGTHNARVEAIFPVPLAEPEPAQPPPAPAAIAPALPGDRIGHTVAEAGFGHTPLLAALRESQTAALGMGQTSAALSIAARYGPAFGQVVAALPTAMRTPFLTQIAANAGIPPLSHVVSTEHVASVSAQSLAAAVAAVASGGDDSAASNAASLLVRYVAQNGIDAAAELLAPKFAASGFAPEAPRTDVRERRKHDEQSRRRRRPAPAQENVEPPADKLAYTIDDIVTFNGVTIAERRTPLPEL